MTRVLNIQNESSGALLGQPGSQSYLLGEIERHLHSYERWLGAAAVPVGETHIADSASDGVAPFSIDAGDDVFGAWVQIIGSEDTPVISGNVKFDLHRIFVESVEKDDHHILQIGFGASGAAALSAEDYLELVFKPTGAGALSEPGPIQVNSRRQNVGTKAWARVLAPSQNTSIVTFFVGIHEYEG